MANAQPTSMKNPLPNGMHNVTPHLVCAGAAEAIDFYKKAFGAEEMVRMPGPGGKLIHACIRIGDSPVMLVDEFPEMSARSPKAINGTPVTLHLYVDDVDAFAANAVEAGAKVVVPVQDMFWGDRYGVLEDPFGHRWSVATPGQPKSPEEIRDAMSKLEGSGCAA